MVRTEPFYKRYWRRILLYAAITLMIVPCSHAVWTFVEWRQYNQRLESLPGIGVRINLPVLQEAEPASDDNAVVVLMRAAEWMASHEASYRKPDGSGPPSSLLHEPEVFRSDWSDEDWNTVREYIESLAPYYERLREAARQPAAALPIDVTPDTDVGRYYYALLDGAIWTRRRTEFADEGDDVTAIAVESANLLFDLADRCELPMYFGQGMRELARWAAVECLKRASQRDSFRRREAREKLDGLLARLSVRRGPPAKPLHDELAFGLWMVEVLAACEEKRLGHGENSGWLMGWLRRPLVYRDGSRFVDRMKESIVACDDKAEATLAHMRRFDEWRQEHGRFFFAPVSNNFAVTPMKYFQTFAITANELRLARVALAILVVHDARGEWPQSVGELKPLFPDGVPQPLEGEWVYSRSGEVVTITAPEIINPDTEQPMKLAWSWAAR